MGVVVADHHRVGAKVGARPGVVGRGRPPLRGGHVHVRVAGEGRHEDAQLLAGARHVDAEELVLVRLEVLRHGHPRLELHDGVRRGRGDGEVGVPPTEDADDVGAAGAEGRVAGADGDAVRRRAGERGRQVVEGLRRREPVLGRAHEEVGGAHLRGEGEGDVVVAVADRELVVDQLPALGGAELGQTVDEAPGPVAGLLQGHVHVAAAAERRPHGL
mmetsp:Transcript_18838/g.55225  ORF Transcript_18838/g.55225 Transcript_18838/m.55225 type:complete len:216 (+) Transcript_18838:3037-3684(+)